VKSKTWDDAILANHRSSIKTDEAKEAFDILVAAGIAMQAYETEAAWQGEVRIFKYVELASGERPFAFIANQKDLLFYVRAAGLRLVPDGFSALKKRFNTATENKRGEWTLRIASTDEAERLVALLFSQHIASEYPGDIILNGVTHEDVLGAIRRLDAGAEHAFGRSLKYDLVVGDRRYPPKAVVGLAAERLVGAPLRPTDFTGGQDSKSTRILRRLGFVVQRKTDNVSRESSRSISPSARTPRPFTQYWKNTTLDWHEADELMHSASNQFRARGVRRDDRISVVTVLAPRGDSPKNRTFADLAGRYNTRV
jgi:hypothetical protein